MMFSHHDCKVMTETQTEALEFALDHSTRTFTRIEIAVYTLSCMDLFYGTPWGELNTSSCLNIKDKNWTMYWAEYYHSSQFYMESAKNWGRFLVHTHTSTDPLSGCMVHLSLAMGSTWKWPLSLDPWVLPFQAGLLQDSADAVSHHQVKLPLKDLFCFRHFYFQPVLAPSWNWSFLPFMPDHSWSQSTTAKQLQWEFPLNPQTEEKSDCTLRTQRQQWMS